MRDSRESKKIAIPILWSISLITAAFLIFSTTRLVRNVNLWTLIILFSIIDAGFIIAFILGVKSKKLSIMIFSIILNSICFMLLSIIIFLLLVANGISET